LQITADVYSGRPNPAWIITDEHEANATLKELARERSTLLDAAPPSGTLGLRGFFIEALDDESADRASLPTSSYLPVGSETGASRVAELAERLIGLMERAQPAATMDTGEEAMALDQDLRDFLTRQLVQPGGISVADERTPSSDAADFEAEAAASCVIELWAFNPGFWNNNATIRSSNNCYNYASNWRTNTFAQPGKGCGNMYKALTCAEVTRAALCDGMRHRFHCFPDSEKPRFLVALVVAPGQDYHWYRKHREGFWGHKPGGTAATNRDNSNKVITDPLTCNRGIYTHFCGYFYGCNSQRQRIR
jgi:hypothetical protein